jgi:uncharacterized protein (TIGR02453 family)
MEPSFSGFADADVRFFKQLARHQDRDWFLAHKQAFEEGYNQPMKALLAELREGIDRHFPHCDLGEAKVFRIFRDVRFSKDKSPYKTHLGGYVPVKSSAKGPGGPVAVYMHVGAEESFAGSGHYVMESPALDRFRAAVVDAKRGKELDGILARLAKKGYAAVSHEALKRVPKGFDPEHPRSELLKGKGLTVTFPKLPKGILASPKLLPWLVSGAKDVAPFVEWLVFATA